MSVSNTNPFEDENNDYSVLINVEGQYSLWPQSIAVPAGWQSTYGPDKRTNCLSYIKNNWLDIRPASLITKN